VPRKAVVWSCVTVVPTTEVFTVDTGPLNEPEASSNRPVPPVMTKSNVPSVDPGSVTCTDPVKSANSRSPFAATNSVVPATENVPGTPGTISKSEL
jgi:hypothetical protein